MTKDDRKKIEIDSEMRNQEISEMIDEGGLGAEKYYDIKKPVPSPESKDKADKPDKNKKED